MDGFLLCGKGLTHWSLLCRWERYFQCHLCIAREVEDAVEKIANLRQPRVVAKPHEHPQSRWAYQKINEIAKSEGLDLPTDATKKAVNELCDRIRDHELDKCQRTHKAWARGFVSAAGVVSWDVCCVADLHASQTDKLLSEAQQAINEIRNGSFCRGERHPFSRHGVRRLFAVLPQHGFTTRYMPIAKEELRALLGMARGQPGGSQLPSAKADDDELWASIFKLRKLQGVQVPLVRVARIGERRNAALHSI